MSQIESMYYEWSDKTGDSEELTIAYKTLADKLTEMLGKSEFNKIDDMIMECVQIERLASFKGGFQQATAIWKECC